MRVFTTPLPLPAAVLRAATRLRPSNAFVRTLVTLATGALAAAICGLVMHPGDSMAQPLAVDAAGPAVSAAQPIEPALGTFPSRPPAAKPAPPRAADSSARNAKRPAEEKSARLDPVAATERLVWDKAPLQVALGIGPDHERSISFPAQMHIGVPQEVAPLLRVQTVGRTSYVTALAPFPRTRVVAEDRATGSVILLDLTASTSHTATQPIHVVVPSAAPADSTVSDGENAPAPVDMMTLTRFAAQQMYAPRRLTGAHPAIRRVMVDRAPLDDLYAGGGVRGTPAAQWRGDEFYVTAVVLQNLQPQPVELTPLDVRGRWRAITFQHGRLLGKGSEVDTTVVYLVCDRPFDACR
jgi:integrating conjugative element protein (TIGR03749 family)